MSSLSSESAGRPGLEVTDNLALLMTHVRQQMPCLLIVCRATPTPSIVGATRSIQNPPPHVLDVLRAVPRTFELACLAACEWVILPDLIDYEATSVHPWE